MIRLTIHYYRNFLLVLMTIFFTLLSFNKTYSSELSTCPQLFQKNLKDYYEKLAKEEKIAMKFYDENAFLFEEKEWDNFFIQGRIELDGGLHLNLSTKKNQRWLTSNSLNSPEVSHYFRGREAIRFALEHFRDKVQYIAADWRKYSDNFKMFQKAIKRYPKLSVKEAAFETWTGKRAKEHGFTRAELKEIKFNQNDNKTYEIIKINFFKD